MLTYSTLVGLPIFDFTIEGDNGFKGRCSITPFSGTQFHMIY